MLRPLADRIIVRPLKPESPESLIVLPESADTGPDALGEVVAVGSGPASVRAQLVKALTGLSDGIAHLQPADAADVGCGAVRKGDVLELVEKLQARLSVPSEVAVGQRVAFPPYVGHELAVDGEEYLVLREDDLLAEVEAE